MRNVTVIGGDATHVRDKMAVRLKAHGLLVNRHIDWAARPPKALPKGTEGVILLVTEADENLIEPARKLARRGGIPIAEVSRKFSRAIPILKMVGLIDGQEGDTEMQETTQAGTDEATHLVGENAPGADRPSVSASQWAALYLEERPEWSDEKILKKIQRESDVQGLDADTIRPIVRQARRTMLNQMKDSRRLPQEQRDRFHAIKVAFVERHYAAELERKGKPPKWDDSREAGVPVFGFSLGSRVVREGRAVAQKRLDGPRETDGLKAEVGRLRKDLMARDAEIRRLEAEVHRLADRVAAAEADPPAPNPSEGGAVEELANLRISDLKAMGRKVTIIID